MPYKQKPRPFILKAESRDQLSKLTGRKSYLDQQPNQLQKLFKASLYNESQNPVSSQAYVGGIATDGLRSAQDPTAGGRLRTEEVPPVVTTRRNHGYWREQAVYSDMQRQAFADQSKQIRQMETHRDNQERLHSLAQPHDQTYCRHCTGSQPSKLADEQKAQHHARTPATVEVPISQEQLRRISPEAAKNHLKMLEFLKDTKSRYRPSERLLKAWYDNSTDPLAQNLLHKMGLAHSKANCPSCSRGEKFEEHAVLQTGNQWF